MLGGVYPALAVTDRYTSHSASHEWFVGNVCLGCLYSAVGFKRGWAVPTPLPSANTGIYGRLGLFPHVSGWLFPINVSKCIVVYRSVSNVYRDFLDRTLDTVSRHFLFDTRSIHTRYVFGSIGASILARYKAEPPPKPRFRIECVSKCIEHTYARWIQLWIHVRYITIRVRYSTIQTMGKIHPAEWGKWLLVLF